MRHVHRLPWLMGTSALGLVAAGVGVVTAPATTKQGVNFAVSTRTLPQYVKAWDFLDRHFHYHLLARDITHGLRGDEERVLAVYRWTRDHIRPTPPDWTVVDDHILHIIIRGHGLSDQMADVFTTLSTYAGVPAFWTVARPKGQRRTQVISLARVEGRWVVFDVGHDVVFRNRHGRLATLEEMAADPELVRTTAGDLQPGGIPYEEYLAAALPLTIPDPLRAEMQMPWPRIRYEASRMLSGAPRP